MRSIPYVATTFAAIFSAAVVAQLAEDTHGFLADWQVLSEQFAAGEIELDAQGLPPGHDTAQEKVTDGGHFKVAVKPAEDSAPFNEIHDWRVHVSTPNGQPVSGAQLAFFGGMPLHNHGYPTEPTIMGEVEPGVYGLAGMKFSMSGWWTVALGIEANGLRDRVSFNRIVTP